MEAVGDANSGDANTNNEEAGVVAVGDAVLVPNAADPAAYFLGISKDVWVKIILARLGPGWSRLLGGLSKMLKGWSLFKNFPLHKWYLESCAFFPVRVADGEPALNLLMENGKDLFVHQVLSFVGRGHYRCVAGVSRDFKKMYLKSVLATRDIPNSFFVNDWPALSKRRQDKYYIIDWPDDPIIKTLSLEPAPVTSTFFSAAFSSVAFAKAWNLETRNAKWRAKPNWAVCELIAKTGNLQVLKWAHHEGFPWNENTCFAAAENGNLSCLQYAHEHGCQYRCAKLWKAAAFGGHIAVLEWLLTIDCPFDEEACAGAAAGGHLDALKWLLTIGCPIDEDACAGAAANGRLDVLKWLRERTNPFSWDSWTACCAAENGHVDCLEYAHKNGCDIGDRGLVRGAAKNGHLDCLKYMLDNGFYVDRYTCEEAAKYGHVECLKCARERQPPAPWDLMVTYHAAEWGYLDCLKYALDNGCPTDPRMWHTAAARGQIRILQYAMHEKGFQFDEGVCASAAANGQLDTLVWLHEEGCPWDKSTCEKAAKYGQFDCLKYAHSHGCEWEWDEQTCEDFA